MFKSMTTTSYNSFNRSNPTFNQLSTRSSKQTEQIPKKSLINFDTNIWLKKRYLKQAPPKYLHLPNVQNFNKTLNKVFGIFASESQKISFKGLLKIFELCGIPISLKDVIEIFSLKKSELLIFYPEKPEISKETWDGFDDDSLTLPEFKKRFLDEKTEQIFKKIMKKYRENKKMSEIKNIFVPTSLKEVLNFLGYKLKRIEIIKQLEEKEGNQTVTDKFKKISSLFWLNVNQQTKKTIENPKKQGTIKKNPRLFSLPINVIETKNDDEEDDNWNDIEELFNTNRLKYQPNEELIKTSVLNEFQQGKNGKINKNDFTSSFDPRAKKSLKKLPYIDPLKTDRIFDRNMKSSLFFNKIMQFNLNAAKNSHEFQIVSHLIK